MTRKYPVWEQPQYDVLAGLAVESNGAGVPWLVATFVNGDVVRLEANSVLPRPELAATADWSTLRLDPDEPFEFTVDTAEGPIEIPAARLRRMTEPGYAALFLDRREDRSPKPAHVGIRLRTLRTLRGFTSKEVAERAGLTPRSLSRIELGQQDVSASALERLLGAMGCRWADLDEAALAKEVTARRGPGRPPKVAAAAPA